MWPFKKKKKTHKDLPHEEYLTSSSESVPPVIVSVPQQPVTSTTSASTGENDAGFLSSISVLVTISC